MRYQITDHSNVCLTAYADPHQKNIKVRITGTFWGNSPVTGEFPAKRASNAEKAYMGLRHHAYICLDPDASA